MLAIALTAWPPYARLARAETLTVRRSDYIAAVRLQGAGAARIILRHIVPMCLPSVIVRVTLDMAGIILTAAGLGFLGLGAQPPLPEWGADDLVGRASSSRPVVGGDHPGPRHLHRLPRLQPARRRPARRARPAGAASGDEPLLEVEDLRVTFPTETGPVEAVRGVSFALGRERLGIVGESGPARR